MPHDWKMPFFPKKAWQHWSFFSTKRRYHSFYHPATSFINNVFLYARCPGLDVVKSESVFLVAWTRWLDLFQVRASIIWINTNLVFTCGEAVRSLNCQSCCSGWNRGILVWVIFYYAFSLFNKVRLRREIWTGRKGYESASQLIK